MNKLCNLAIALTICMGCSVTRETTQTLNIPYKPPIIQDTTQQDVTVHYDSLCNEQMEKLANELGNYIVDLSTVQGDKITLTSTLNTKNAVIDSLVKKIRYLRKLTATVTPHDTVIVKEAPLIQKTPLTVYEKWRVEAGYYIFLGSTVVLLLLMVLIVTVKL